MKRLVSIIFLGFILLLPQKADAFTVIPSYMDLPLEKGERVEKSITLQNDASESAKFSFEVADVKFSADGTPQFLPDPEPGANSLKWWINFDESMLELGPGEKKELKVNLSVPEAADPGGHYGAVVFSKINRQEQQDKTAVGVTQKLAVLMFLNVEGQVNRFFEIEKFSPNSTLNNSLPVKFTILINNKGNTHLQPHGVISVLDTWRNKQVGKVLVNEEFLYLFPQGNKLFEVTWADPNPLGSIWRYFGRYKAVLEMKAEGASDIKSEAEFWVLPANLIMLVSGISVSVLILLLLYTKIILSRHNRSRSRADRRGGYG